MHALDILGDPVRRRILELLADGQASAGELGRVIHQEFGISQPAVSQHLRVLRESGFTTVHPEGTRRLYAIEPAQLAAADEWFDAFRGFWQPRLDALGTELARGRRERRLATPPSLSDCAEEAAEAAVTQPPGPRTRAPQHPKTTPPITRSNTMTIDIDAQIAAVDRARRHRGARRRGDARADPRADLPVAARRRVGRADVAPTASAAGSCR